jgi:hypothetical protein
VVLVDVLAEDAAANAAAIEARGGQAIAVAADIGETSAVAAMVQGAVDVQPIRSDEAPAPRSDRRAGP